MTKYAIVIMDGAADEPLAELDGQTVLQRAHIPNTDWISSNGQLGMVNNVPGGMPPGSDVALMSVLGYDPKKFYTGRAPLEAAAKNIKTETTDWILRCNLVTVADEIMLDYSAGHIDSIEAAKLINDINQKLGNEQISFYPGVGYRHLMVHKGGPFDMELAPPHDIMDEPIAKYLPKGKKGKELCEIMADAAEILDKHEVNKVRRDLGENPATNIWLWGQGHKPTIEAFKKKFGISAAVITAVDLLRGLGTLMGMDLIEVEGANGYLDTNYAGKGQAAITAIEQNELVVVHIEAPDEAGHGAMVQGKIEAIERIDAEIVGPLLKHMQKQKDWRIMVLPDHPTPIRLRTHTSEAVPVAIAGAGIKTTANKPQTYNEQNAAQSGFKINKGHELMEYFLKVKR